MGLNVAVSCTDSPKLADWTLQRLQPRSTCVLLGLPEDGLKLDAFNLVFRELNVKDSLHCSREEVEKC
jgi:D-arabinose 1-dehydrogenase-like Zn-dependent alcohol dehydrogenase